MLGRVNRAGGIAAMTDFRALCEELVDELSVWTGYGDDAGAFPEADFDGVHALIDRAHAALAEQPVGQPVIQPYKFTESGDGPADKELLAMRSWSSHSHTFDSDLVDFARAVLARWGAPAATPLADGEVERLQWIADEFAQGSELKGSGYASDIQAVIKHILHQRPAAVPIPTAERLPCLEDCDEQGRCWFHSTGRAWCDWYLLTASSATDTETHWLPANALPTPRDRQ